MAGMMDARRQKKLIYSFFTDEKPYKFVGNVLFNNEFA